MVGQRERLVAELERGGDELSGSEAPSRNEKAEWQWSSTYIEHMFASGPPMDTASSRHATMALDKLLVDC